jgi:hypothetical protein
LWLSSSLICCAYTGFAAHDFPEFCFGLGRIRQYPQYSKEEPPASLAQHFDADVFDKSQKYGKDKAKFALFSVLYRQTVESLMLHYDVYTWAWTAGRDLLSKFGFGPEYEVKVHSFVTQLCHA